MFKGIHKNVDSYTGVPQTDNEAAHSYDRQKDSGKNCGCTNEPGDNSCSIKTGCFKVKQGMLLTNTDGLFEDKPYEFEQDIADNSNTNIYVCGLAGDYCVRDTMLNLAIKFPQANIILLHHLTRYAFLPTWIPVNTGADTYDAMKFMDVGDKDMNYYLFMLGEKGFKMMPSGVLRTMDDFKDTFVNGQLTKMPDGVPKYWHFITGTDHVMKGYTKHDNIKIVLEKDPVVSE